MQAGEIATACHLIGKRWALQVVRELALGPWRFTDLHHRLQGISTTKGKQNDVRSRRVR
jgi:DNA-binding HxlR family transcriptional regulator